MKANEAPKSKFVYPDKLYARCKDNKTLDMSYAPQTLEAVEYTRTDAFIEKAVSWLKENADKCITIKDGAMQLGIGFYINFKRAMKGE